MSLSGVASGRLCWHCKMGEDILKERHKRCTRCLEALYCSKACQRTDYKEHKKFCAQKLELRKDKLTENTQAFIEKVEDYGKRFFESEISELEEIIAEKNRLVLEANALYGHREGFIDTLLPLSIRLEQIKEAMYALL